MKKIFVILGAVGLVVSVSGVLLFDGHTETARAAAAAWAVHAIGPEHAFEVTMCADFIREHRQRFAGFAIQLLLHSLRLSQAMQTL